MNQRQFFMTSLADLAAGQEADVFAMLSVKESLTTRDGKPYFKVGFRDSRREISFPIWSDTAHFVDCRDNWKAGSHYKLRTILRETNYGPQLEIYKIRAVNEADQTDGYDPWMFLPRSKFKSEEMFAEMVAI